jgi:hypothetical protein
MLVHAPILNRLRNMLVVDLFNACQIPNGSRDFQDAVIGSRG